MALGDGIRRNIHSVSPEERTRFINAILRLHPAPPFDGQRGSLVPTGGVSRWFKQDEIHQATHVHRTPAFLPWHRELCNRFEAMLREVDPALSLHYWDWNYDPHDLFSSDFMGNDNGDVGEPWLSAHFYDPGASEGHYRDDYTHYLNRQTAPYVPYDNNANPADPPKHLTRAKAPGNPPVGQRINGPWQTIPQGAYMVWPSDGDLLLAPTYQEFKRLMHGVEDDASMFDTSAHAAAHAYIGGNIAGAFGQTFLDPSHISFRDPFVFLLHSNIDRLWALWQTWPGFSWRLDPNQVYGSDLTDGVFGPLLRAPLQPWAGEADWLTTSGWPVQPWFGSQSAVIKNCLDPSVVCPPAYEGMPDPGLIQIAMDDWFMRDADVAAGADQETVDLAHSITRCRYQCWFDESDLVHWAFLPSVGPLRILKRYLHHLVAHRRWKGGNLPPGLEVQWITWERHAPKIVVDSPWSMRMANIHVSYPMDPNALPNTFGPTALNVNGTLELTITNASATVDHICQQLPTLAWSVWRQLSGVDRDGNTWSAGGNPQYAQDLDGTLEIWVLDRSGSLWQTQQMWPNGDWQSWWTEMGSGFGSDPAFARNITGTLEAFAITSTGQLQHSWQNQNGWGDWFPLTTPTLQGHPVVAQNASGALEVFAQESITGAVGHVWQTPTAASPWSNWQSLGGSFTGSPAVGVNMDGCLEVFAVNGSGLLEHNQQTSPGGVWGGWTSGISGVTLVGEVAVAQNRDGRLEVFGRDTKAAIQHIWQVSPGRAWGSWTSLGGSFVGRPIVGINSDGRLELFARASDTSIQHTSQAVPNGRWAAWASLGPPT